MKHQLTADQVRLLAPYERNFTQAINAAWCSYPGQEGINTMRDVWQALTGSPYPYKPGCPNCLLNLVRDMGTVYFEQKDAVLAAEAAEKATAEPDPVKEAATPGKTKKAAKPKAK